jgi:elongation factor G
MKNYITKNLRNIGIIGHSGAGKSTLVEAILYYTKAVDRFGKIEDGTTVSDYDLEEKKRTISISTSICTCEWQNIKMNLIDMPGYFDFAGEVVQGLRASDIAMIVVSGNSGIQVGTEKSWRYVDKYGIPRAFYINKLDRENSNFNKVLSQLKENFGMSVVPLQYPIGIGDDFTGVINIVSQQAKIFDKNTNKTIEIEIPKELISKVEELKGSVIEAVAETNEYLLDKYFSDGTLSDEDIYAGLINACAKGLISPVMCGAALSEIGTESLLEDIVKYFPSPENIETTKAINIKDSTDVNISVNEGSAFSSFIFKTIADPFVGKLSLFKVITGKVKSDTVVYNINKDKSEKIGSMYFLRGKQQIPTNEIITGDIGAVSKLQYTTTGDTLCAASVSSFFPNMEFPTTVMSMSVVAKSKNDEDKISSGLSKLSEEDCTFKVSRDLENAETIISGLGETHLEVIACKLKNKFGVEVALQAPKIPYRETIKKAVDIQGKHKKQSGGHGQYGDVRIKFEPRNDDENDMQFIDQVVGGAVPRQYIPAVEKGLRECIQHGVLAGYPVIKLKATLYDGSYHPVDSSEMAFKLAASVAYKKGLLEAKPIILEPIMHVEIMVPEYYMGDIIGDINKRRGRILGMESYGDDQRITAEVPQAEMFKYATDLRSITQARGSFMMKFEKYEEVIATEVNKIIEEAKKTSIKVEE